MQEGDKIRDYILEEKIGEGGMGEVWKARHAILDRRVAIKAMARHLEADPEFGRRFLQEAQSQARLSHPRIVGVSDFFAEDGEYFLVMPLLSGENLADRLHKLQAPLPVSDALTIARDVLDALDYAHQQGVIHRDVKPSNILLDSEGHAALTDFGIALSLGRQRVTHTTTSLGTPHYMSPEQIRSPRTIDHRTDVYSFGCVLYEMLTGHPPFAEAADAEDTDFALKEAHVYRAPESLRKRNPQVPAWLDAVVLRALAKNPDERFPGCGEFRRNLDAPAAVSPPAAAAAIPAGAPDGELRQSHPPIVRKPGPPPAAQTRRVPAALIVVLALAVAALAALVFATRSHRGTEERTADTLTTDLGTSEPVEPDVKTAEARQPKPIQIEEVETDEPPVTEVETVEPLVTDIPPAEPAKDEKKDDKADKKGDKKDKKDEKKNAKKDKQDKKNETREPLSTDVEIDAGIRPPADLGTVEPLGTDMKPPL